MLGSVSELDDAVQGGWLRFNCADTSGVENLGSWLTTVVGRVCLNMLRSRKSWREDSLEAHVPDPVVSHEDGTHPDHEALPAISRADPSRCNAGLARGVGEDRAQRYLE
jgi:DNA-directed RNA polymerase specialized sigma24 family protein